MSDTTPEGRLSARSPFYEARHAPRYERQRLIRDYQEAHGCRLVVLIDTLFPDSITLFEETLHDADPEQDLHVSALLVQQARNALSRASDQL